MSDDLEQRAETLGREHGQAYELGFRQGWEDEVTMSCLYHGGRVMTDWCCGDCLLLFANGEVPPEMDDSRIAAWLAEINRRVGSYEVMVGGEHEYNGPDDHCPNLADDGSWDGSTDCTCEEQEFSWSQCQTCGSTLGGSRHAVTLFEAR